MAGEIEPRVEMTVAQSTPERAGRTVATRVAARAAPTSQRTVARRLGPVGSRGECGHGQSVHSAPAKNLTAVSARVQGRQNAL